MKKLPIIIVLGLLLAPLICLNAAPLSESPRIELVNADSTGFHSDKQGELLMFWGHVHFRRGASSIKADAAIRRQPQNYVYLMGNVNITDSERSIRADSVFYDENLKLTRAFGHVRIEQKVRVISADSIYYYEDDRIISAFGGTQIIDRSRHVMMEGETSHFHEKEERLLIYGSPRLVLDYDLSLIRTEITADTIEVFAQEDIIIATDSVRITQGTLTAHADDGEFYPGKEEYKLSGNVWARQRDNTLSGDQMNIYSQDKVLQRIEVEGNGRTVFRQPARADTLVYNESRLNSDKISFYFENDLITRINALGNSYTYYQPAREDTASQGSNTASGDSTILHFSDGHLQRMIVITSAEGTYITPKAHDSLGNVTLADTVDYKAERIDYRLADDQIQLLRVAEVDQADVNLKGDRIDYDVGNKTLHAFGYFDSTSMEYIPIQLRDRSETVGGEQLAYDMVTKRGKLKKTRSKMDKAYFSGEELRKEEEGEFLVCGGGYTTCELKEPHFHFWSPNMKVVTGDRVVARPIVLYIETLPVLALPYYVFSIKKGRHSGMLPFQIGNLERGNRFVNNLGYYWALSDYWDLRTWLDIGEASGTKFNATVRYAQRYKLNSSLSASFNRQTVFSNFTRGHRTRSEFRFSHNQTIDPTLTLKGSGYFVSDAQYYSDFSTDLEERLNRQVRSQINLSKRWDWGSMTAVVEQTKDLDSDEHSEQLPTVSFSKPDRPFFSQPKLAGDKRWYHNLYYRYSSRFKNRAIKSSSSGTISRTKYVVFDQTASLRAPQKLINAITVTPSVTISDFWYYLPYSSSAVEDEIETNDLKNRQTWRSSLAVSTNLYGTVTPNIAGVTGLRHVMSPSATFSYTPEFLRNKEYAGYTGVGGSGNESKSVSFSLRNQFQMKYQRDEREVKQTLFNFDLSSRYDFTRDDRRWGNISSSVRTPSIRNFSLQINMTHDPYDEISGKLRWWNPRLLRFSVQNSFRAVLPFPGSGGSGKSDSGARLKTLGSQPLRFAVEQTYSESRSATSKSITHWLKVSLEFSPSKNWRVKYNQNYDFRKHETTFKEIIIERDLHCWQGQFTWIPEGSMEGFYFRLNVKLLPSLKFEKSESGIQGVLESTGRSLFSQ